MQRFQVGEFVIDPVDRTVKGPGGGETRLEPKVMAVLYELARRPGTVVSRQALTDSVWDIEAGADESLTRAISKLRSVFGDSRTDPHYIETVQKGGYRLHTQSATPLTSRRVAVIPFAVRGGNERTRAAAEGLTDAIGHTLAQVDGIDLVSRSAAGALAAGHSNPDEFRAQLGAEFLVEGRIDQQDGSSRIFIEISSTETHDQQWSDVLDVLEKTIRQTQDDVADRIRKGICRVLGLAVPDDGTTQAPCANEAAYVDYLIGRRFWETDNDNPEQALKYFERAIEADPSLSEAHAGLVDCYCTFGVWQLMPQAEARRLALTYAEKAMRANRTSPETVFSAGYVQFYATWNLHKAEELLQRAVDMAPGDPRFRSFQALLYAAMGRFGQAKRAAEATIARDPVSGQFTYMSALVYYYAREYEEAARILSVSREVSPDFAPSLWLSGMSHARLGEQKQALRMAERLKRDYASLDARLTYIIKILAETGENETAERLLPDLVKRHTERGVSPFWLSGAHLACGYDDRALAEMRNAFEERNMTFFHLFNEPNADRLQADPDFQRMKAYYQTRHKDAA